MTGNSKVPLVLIVALLGVFLLSSIAYAQVSTSCPIAAYEGSIVKLSPTAYDPDPEIGPAGALILTFGSPFNSTGGWQTVKGQRGVFPFWVSVSDGDLSTTNYSCVEVLPRNQDPILQSVPDVHITRGENTEISASCYDPDGDPVSISYRFNGKDVSFIQYEPPGIYTLEVICEDGYGGVDTEKADMYVDMPYTAPAAKPKPAPVVIAQPKPSTVELVLPKNNTKPEVVEVRYPAPPKPDVVEVHYPVSVPSKPDVVEVRYPADCPPCPQNASAKPASIDVVIYNTASQLDTSANTTRTFVIEEPAKPAAEVSSCDEGLKRKAEISAAYGCC
ncbi:hypothetical protein KY363_06440 [Candidatus Woesearchaeota archaeon]|nr:hypothetical protein [Candidatus Woesearchaeota archaeon]